MSDPYSDGVTPAAPPAVAAAQPPPEGETTTSVLQMGTSPWMRSTVTGAPGTSMEMPSDARTAIMFKGPRSVVDKEREKDVRGARKHKVALEELARGREEERKFHRIRWYFCVGCFGVPLLHFVSVVYFLRELKGHDRDFKIKKYVYLSLIVGIIESFILILWVVVFQLLRDTTLSSVNILNSNITAPNLI